MRKNIAEDVKQNKGASGDAALALLSGILMLTVSFFALLIKVRDKKLEEKTGEDLC